MRPSPTLPALAALALAACAAEPGAPAPEPTRFVEPPPAPAPAYRPVSLPAPARDPPPPDAERHGPSPTPAQVRALVDGAKARSLDLPTPECFKGKACEYWYDPEQHYLVYMAVLNQTLVRMEPGETVLDVIAPGTTVLIPHERFHFGSGAGRTELVAFMPRQAGLVQQLSILTDRRKYDLQVETFTRTHHVEVRWRYVEDYVRQAAGAGARDGGPAAPADRVTGMAPRDRHCGYQLYGATPRWRPTRTPDGQPPVCDDGEVTVVNFPVGLGAIGAPNLWRVTAEGARTPVQYGKVNSTYRVAGVHHHLVLELDGEVVELVREGDGKAGAP